MPAACDTFHPIGCGRLGTVTSFRYPAGMALTALLAAVSSGFIAAAGDYWVLVPLAPLLVAIWAWRAGTDANEYGIRVRALVGRKIIPWTEVAALGPDARGGAMVALSNGKKISLTAVKATDLPRLIAASGKTAAEA